MEKLAQVLDDIDNIRTTAKTLRLQMGPANADYTLERLERIENYVKDISRALKKVK